jgi:hypothetical protein
VFNMKDMSVFDFLNDIDEQVQNYLAENFQEATSEDCGLDRRAASLLYVNDEAIVCPKSYIKTLDYYGGFEYVDSDYRKEIGDYIFFSHDDERVFESIVYALKRIDDIN